MPNAPADLDFAMSLPLARARTSGEERPILSRRQTAVLAIVCGVIGVIAWAFYVWAFSGDPGQDWMVFYTAGRAYFDGNLPLIFDGETLTAALNQRFAAWLHFTLNLHPWVYPPTFLLLFLPFAALPPILSLPAFLLSGFAALLAAVWAYLGRGPARAMATFSLLLCPAVPFNVMTGQNAFFTAALLVGGFGLLDRAPVAAGALLGLLSFKPQLCLMVPVALLAARQWRALASAAAAGCLLALLSYAVFGYDAWRAWVELVTGMDPAYRAWVANGRLNGVSVFACVSLLGAPGFIATAAQAAAIAIAAAIVYWIYRWPSAASAPLPLAGLFAATMLAAPHASASDAVMLALATTLFVAAPRQQELRPLYLALAAAVWVSPLLNPPSVFRAGCLTPVLILLFLAAIIAELRQRRPAALPSPAGVSPA